MFGEGVGLLILDDQLNMLPGPSEAIVSRLSPIDLSTDITGSLVKGSTPGVTGSSHTTLTQVAVTN